MPMPNPTTELTERERSIARLVIEELTDEAIAYRLGLSRQHVKNTLVELRRKLGATPRVGVALAVERGQVPR
jgi:DNA-binding NarL/FixJ family response regulator